MHHSQISSGLAGSASFFSSRQFLPVAMYSPWSGKSMTACPMQRAKNTWKAAKSWCGGVSSSPDMPVKILSDREAGNLKINRRPTFHDPQMTQMTPMDSVQELENQGGSKRWPVSWMALLPARKMKNYGGGRGTSLTGWGRLAGWGGSGCCGAAGAGRSGVAAGA